MRRVSSLKSLKTCKGLDTRSTRWSILRPSETPHENLHRQVLTGAVHICEAAYMLLIELRIIMPMPCADNAVGCCLWLQIS